MTNFIIFFAFIFHLHTAPQVYQVKDVVTHETICGAKITVNGNTMYTNTNGEFSYHTDDFAKVSMISYNDTTVNLTKNTIYLTPTR